MLLSRVADVALKGGARHVTCVGEEASERAPESEIRAELHPGAAPTRCSAARSGQSWPQRRGAAAPRARIVLLDGRFARRLASWSKLHPGAPPRGGVRGLAARCGLRWPQRRGPAAARPRVAQLERRPARRRGGGSWALLKTAGTRAAAWGRAGRAAGLSAACAGAR
jgi:hypothetical protein